MNIDNNTIAIGISLLSLLVSIFVAITNYRRFRIKELPEITLDLIIFQSSNTLSFYLINVTNADAINVTIDVYISLNNKNNYITTHSYNYLTSKSEYKFEISDYIKEAIHRTFLNETIFEPRGFRRGSLIFKNNDKLELELFTKTTWKPPLFKQRSIKTYNNYKIIVEKCLTDNGKDFVISNFKIIKTRTFIPFKIRIKLFKPFYID